MTDQDRAADAGQPLANGADTTPAAGLISQYVKDLSFENPNAPAIYQAQTAPSIDVQFNIAANQVADDVHESVLKIEVRAESDGTVAFIVDLSFAGLFGFRNIPADQIQPMRSSPSGPARQVQPIRSRPSGPADPLQPTGVSRRALPAGPRAPRAPRRTRRWCRASRS